MVRRADTVEVSREEAEAWAEATFTYPHLTMRRLDAGVIQIRRAPNGQLDIWMTDPDADPNTIFAI